MRLIFNSIKISLLFSFIIFLVSFNSKNEPIVGLTKIENKTSYYEYKHNKCLSITSKFVKFGIGLIRNLRSKEISNKAESTVISEMKVPKSIKKNYIYKETIIDGKKVAVITPKGKSKNEKVVIYIHGGAYIFNITKFHWGIINIYCKKTGYTFIVPDYPLAPNSKAIEVVNFINKVYLNTLKEFPTSKVTIMGDSAGGGLTLAFAETIKDNKKITRPNQLILLSPWVDLTHNNPEIKLVEKNDKMLKVSLLDLCAKKYRGSLNLTDPKVSPINGDLKNLPPTSVFIGTHDVLFPDAKKLKDKLVLNSVKTSYFEYPKSFHVFMGASFTPEAKSANKQIVELLLAN